MGDNNNTAEKVNERMGHKAPGEAKTDDDVQNAVDDADGKHDGDIANEPESDVQAAIHVYEEGSKDGYAKLDLAAKAAKAIFTKGERHVLPEDWAQLATILGPVVINLVKALVLLVK